MGKREATRLKEEAQACEDCDARKKEQLMNQHIQTLTDRDAYMREEERKAQALAPPNMTCEDCGTAYVTEAERKTHEGYTRHTSFLLIKEKIEELRKNKAARPSEETPVEKKDAEDKKEDKKEDDRKKDDDRGGRRGSGGKEGEKKNGRSRSRDNRRSRDRKRSRERRSRDRGKRDRSRSRDRGRRDRSRSRRR